MNAVTHLPEPEPPQHATSAGTPVLRTLVLADLVEHAERTERIDDERGIETFRQLDRIGRDLLARHGGREIDKTDGFLVLFDRPIQAIAFALDYQRALHALAAQHGRSWAARIGIHVGDVLIWDNDAADVAQGAKPIEVEGLVKPVAARLMGLARPRQILLTGVAHTLAQRGMRELRDRAGDVRLKYHGRYRFKGVAEAIPVYEVGEPGVAPLKRPPTGDKAWRESPRWRRPKALLAEFAALIVAVAAALWFGGHTEPAIAFAERDWVVLGDLRNLSGEKTFDDALQTALRISLEQSRFVNVVSDLQVRDSLGRMTRTPGTAVDRMLGSEIALREGARALIVPTVAQVGGRLRISAEVVDPRTQATVYVAFADGAGTGSALSSVDKVTRSLRGDLGEAVKSIDSDSAPLPKVATHSLDALRAYAVAQREQARGRYTEAQTLYQQAIDLDRGFALAYMGIARIHYAADNRPKSYGYLKQALAHPDRLTARDKLYLDAWLDHFGPPDRALKKWKSMIALYPDFYTAYYNYAFFDAHFSNRYDDAVPYVQKSLSAHNYFLASSHYQLGTLFLGLDRTDEALQQFRRSEELGVGGSLHEYAYAYAVKRNFDEAERIFKSTRPTGVASNDIFDRVVTVALAMDQGDPARALGAARAAAVEAEHLGPLYVRIFRGMELSLSQFSETHPRLREALREFIETELAAAAQADNLDRNHAAFAAVAGAYLAARNGETALARRSLTAIDAAVAQSGFPNAMNLLTIARAELRRAEGDPATAITLLDGAIDGAALFQAHVARLGALTDAGRNGEALREAEWLARHRGLAYAEFGSYHLLKALNLADSNLALLRSAELQAGMDHKDEATRSLAEFRRAWPEADRLEFVGPRLKSLVATLQPAVTATR